MRANGFIGAIILLACALGLYQVKYVVRNVRKNVTSLTKQLKEEQQAMHVLDAEWAHLIRPDRLAQLSGNHLGLIPVSVQRMQDVGQLPPRETETAAAEAPATPAHASVAAMAARQLAKQVNYAH